MAEKQTITSCLAVAPVSLCLEFVNTEGTVRNSPPDRLDTLKLFCEWGAKHGLLAIDAATAMSWPGSSTEEFLTRAKNLREALYGIFRATIYGTTPADDDLATFESELALALSRLRLVWQPQGFAWRLPAQPQQPAELLWPIVTSAADLLRSELLQRVKECQSETCSWMFIDESRNRSRRWCDMADCGNRAKARRFYKRHLAK